MRYRKLLATAGVLLLLTGTRPVGAGQDLPVHVAPGKPGDWRSAPEYVRLFAPERAHMGAYRMYVSPLGLQTVLSQLGGDPSFLRPPGAWMPVALLPSDAFGQTGSYDRWKMAKLYGASRALVARGPIARVEGPTEERPTEAWTLISPYPDASLERLEPGTLLIVLDLQAP